MHYTGGIIDYTYLGCSHVLATYPCSTTMSFSDHAECCIQGCIRWEQGNWMEKEDESIIQKSIFLGIGFANDEDEPKKITGELKKQKEWNIRTIAEQLRHFADNFEAEFEKAYATIQPHRKKTGASLFFNTIKYMTDIANGQLADIV